MQQLKWWSSLALCATLVALVACAPATRVVLLPEAGGRATAVEVKSKKGTQTLTQPYQSAEVRADGRVALVRMDPLSVMDRYGGMMTQIPEADEHFVLYFQTGGSELTRDSQALLPKILERAHARKGGEIIVVGHTDRVGTLDANDALSMQRAQFIREIFITRGFQADLIEAVGRGERSPLVTTDDEVEEPKNRRAEIVVR